MMTTTMNDDTKAAFPIIREETLHSIGMSVSMILTGSHILWCHFNIECFDCIQMVQLTTK